MIVEILAIVGIQGALAIVIELALVVIAAVKLSEVATDAVKGKK